MLIVASTITGCISIFTFDSLGCVPVGIMRPAVGIKIYAITTEVKKYRSIVKKKKKKHEKIVLLGKNKLNAIEILISKVLIDSYISHDKSVSVNRNFSVSETYTKAMETYCSSC